LTYINGELFCESTLEGEDRAVRFKLEKLIKERFDSLDAFMKLPRKTCNFCGDIVKYKYKITRDVNKFTIQPKNFVNACRGISCISKTLNPCSYEYIKKSRNLTDYGTQIFFNTKGSKISKKLIKNFEPINAKKKVIENEYHTKIKKCLYSPKFKVKIERFCIYNKIKPIVVVNYINKHNLYHRQLSFKNEFRYINDRVCKFCEVRYSNLSFYEDSVFCSNKCYIKYFTQEGKNNLGKKRTKEHLEKHAKIMKDISKTPEWKKSFILGRIKQVNNQRKVKENGKTGYENRFDTYKNTMIKRYGTKFNDNEQTKAFKEYKRQVGKFQDDKYIREMDNFGKKKYNTQIDHIFPLYLGFKYSIPDYIMGDSDNIRPLLGLINFRKHSKLLEIPDVVGAYIESNNIEIEEIRYTYLIDDIRYNILPLEECNNENVKIIKEDNERF